MSNLFQNYPSWWNSNDHQISESLSQSLSLKVNSPPQLRLNVTSLGFQLQDQDSSSSQSTQSNHDLLTANPGVNSQDNQCISSESGHPETASNTAHIDYGPTVAYMPHPCGDTYFNGLFSASAYGPASAIQNQFMGVTNARVPLPLDMSEDEPIYVNAKQYHGILRRRQSRAKLEAQNKLIRARKPYLHESRHRHALNRVRGTGGRFLSTKKLQQSDSNSSQGNHQNSNLNPYGHSNVNHLGFESNHQPQCIETGTSNLSSGNAFYQQTDGGFLGMSMQANGAFMDSTSQHRAPVVR